ncbi:MAG TPA: hypothetical protein VN106_02490 [Sphingomicrobium sp.]|nr:hypothetical protein [Sphingomicrobium sp.]
MARGKDMTLVGGDRPKKRKQTKRDWTRAKARAFLNTLVETCNVSEACRESGVSVSAAYARRKIDAAFRASWLEAIGIAYQRLELVLLDRAFNGVEKLVTRKDGSEERMREYSNQLGLALLKMHRDTAQEANLELQPSDIEEIRERLIQKLRRLKDRTDAEVQGA